MSSLALLILVALVIAIVLAALTKKKGSSGTVGFPYQPAKTLFSAAERSFLGVLDQAVGSEHRVFGKVRLADVATVNLDWEPLLAKARLIALRTSTSTLLFVARATWPLSAL